MRVAKSEWLQHSSDFNYRYYIRTVQLGLVYSFQKKRNLSPQNLGCTTVAYASHGGYHSGISTTPLM